MLTVKNLGKKFLAGSLAAAMLAATGCGTTSNSSVSSSAENKETSSAGGDSSSGKKVTISVYRPSFNIASPDTNEVKKVQDEINAYIGDKINVEIKLNDIGSGEYTDKCNLALGAGEVVLFFTANWMQTIKTDDVVKQNAVYDLTELLPKYDIYKAIPDWVWPASSFDGKNYFIPCYKESAEGYNLMFRKDLIDKYGWDISKVKSLKDIEPMLADCKKEGLKYPYLTQKTAMFYRYYLDKYDFFSGDSFIAVDKDKDAVVDTVLSNEYKEFASLMGDWADKGYLSEDDLTKTTTDTTIQTADWGISWWTDVPNNDEADTRYKRQVEMAKVTKNWIMSNTTLGSCYAISSKAKEEEAIAALKFLSLLYTDQKLADLYTFGIEGIDYTRNSDGTITKSDKGLYNHSAWESTSVTILSLEQNEPSNKIELYKKFNDTADKSKAAGFRFDKSSVDAQYAACVQVFNEFGFALENGGYSPADVDKAIQDYQKALDDAGYQTVLAEAQKQYENWKKVR
ncbi:MAG TPA: ABC transporter substrate-binding protein [Oscillospiraceae bacterium]|nr:ABC transporter substrate-binding protein [Oscillospiraceae bacterium]